MMKYVIFGNGWIGNKFSDYLNHSVLVGRRIHCIDDVIDSIRTYSPVWIINCIGKTGRPNIDWCESHKEETFFSNTTVPLYMAEACEQLGIHMVHLGSGCIYEGDKLFTEEDIPNFQGSWYSQTKIYAERLLADYSNILQLRVRMPIDTVPSQRNLIDKLKSYSTVINVPNSVTCIPDLLEVAHLLMERGESGIFNVVQKGSVTHEEILVLYKEIVDLEFTLPEFVGSIDGLTLAGRSNCTLELKHLEHHGVHMRDAKDAVADCLKIYKKQRPI